MLTLADLRRFAEEKMPESQVLEFKRSDSVINLKQDKCKREFCKDISGMANASGGTIVCGIEEINSSAEKLDSGIPYSQISLETIEDIVTSNIRPTIPRIKMYQIDSGNGSFYLVIEVPAMSEVGPHQNSDKLYYGRRNTKVEALFDHEIRALTNQRRFASIEPLVSPWVGEDDRWKINFSCLNRNSNPSEYTLYYLMVDVRAAVVRHESFDTVSRANIDVEGRVNAVNLMFGKKTVPTFIPIFKEMGKVQLATACIEPLHESERLFIGAACFGPGYSNFVHGEMFRSNGRLAITNLQSAEFALPTA